MHNEYNLAICINDSQAHIGNIYLRSIDWLSRHASIEIFIGETANQSKGYGQSALRQIMLYAFVNLGLHKLTLQVLADNGAAIHVYKKCGFQVEGSLRKHLFKNGDWQDVLCMGILVEEWHRLVNV